MALYEGTIVSEPRNTASEHAVTVDGQPLKHQVRHSPAGFSWGYAGSGPADLARSILWHHLGREPEPKLYQEFKFEFIATIPQDADWKIDSHDIERWLGTRE